MRLAAPEGHPLTYPPPAFAGERVLIAEDQSLIALELTSLLEQEGASVILAATVSKALQVVGTPGLSAGVLDMRLRDEDVDPVCQALCGHQVPFVFYTGMPVTRERWPAVPVIQKRATPAAIVGALKYVLSADRHDSFWSASLDSHDAEVTSAERRVAEGEERIFRMRCLVTRLKANGFDTTAARELLAVMTKTLDLMHDHRRRVASQAWRSRRMPRETL